MLLGKYELGRTLGEGSFGKVKHARHVDDGREFAVKILDRHRILVLGIGDQIKREIGILKLLKHPNVVRLYEVLASKTKIYMILEYVNGGELFDKIALKGRLSEVEGRRLFQQLIDAVSYCHGKGVFHRDLKPENVLIDAKGNIKISDFGLSALPQHFGNDGLLHTTCGSPNYVAPEVLTNRGYDGGKSDIWSCGVILYVILTGSLPFDDRNLAVLYQKVAGPNDGNAYPAVGSRIVACMRSKKEMDRILKGDFHIPKWLSPGARNMIQRILDPNPITRLDVAGIKAHEWFKQDYTPVIPYDDGVEEDISIFNEAFLIKEPCGKDEDGHMTTAINAFELIGMSSCLDLSGFFEKEDVSERKIRFTSNYSLKDLFEKMEDIVTGMGFQVQKGHGKLKVMQECNNSSCHQSLLVVAEVFELSPSLHVVELRKSHGDPLLYRQLYTRLLNDLGTCKSQQLFTAHPLMLELKEFEGELPTAVV